MFARPFKVFGLALLYLVSAGVPDLHATADSNAGVQYLYAVTEVKAGSNGHFFTTAEINGNAIQVVIDTGASAVALSYEDAERAGLRPRNLSYSIPVNTANGVVKAAEVSLSRVEISGVRVNDVKGWVLPQGALRGTLLGMSFLSKLRGFSVEDGRLTLKN
jgi:aspartyl protease family protein